MKAFIMDICSYYGFDNGFLSHSRYHNHCDCFAFLKATDDLPVYVWERFLERGFGELMGFVFIIQNMEYAIVSDVDALVAFALGNYLLHILDGGAYFLVNLISENIRTSK